MTAFLAGTTKRRKAIISEMAEWAAFLISFPKGSRACHDSAVLLCVKNLVKGKA